MRSMMARSAGRWPYGLTPSTRSPRARFRSLAALSFRTMTFFSSSTAQGAPGVSGGELGRRCWSINAIGGEYARTDLRELPDDDRVSVDEFKRERIVSSLPI